jgi:four helix bundle protein
MPPITSHRQLVAWQLCEELSEAVCALLAKGPGAKDFNLCDQLHRSADAPAPLIAEGFGRRTPGEAAHYLRMADGSLRESSNWLERGIKRRYWPIQEAQVALTLCWRALDMTRKLLESKERQIAAQANKKRKRRLR